MTLSFLGLGLALGLRHALEADHLSAVSVQVTQVNNAKKIADAVRYGLLWGAGHAGMLLLLGGGLLFFQKNIPQTLALFFEALVGILLIIFGVLAWRNEHRKKDKGKSREEEKSKEKEQSRAGKKSFALGSMHGLAGSSAIMVLLAATEATPWKGLFFLLLFGVGGILSMIVFSTLLSLPLRFLKQKKIQSMLPRLAAMSSIIMGAVVLVRVYV